ncbi:MAG TPA: secretin N-terminal domain-containing protein [Chthoniobacterales bacterium]|nr:secretin N-terminal domain-containing protein [Chthoniobacterales bacterium]
MSNSTKQLIGVLIVSLTAAFAAPAQEARTATAPSAKTTAPAVSSGSVPMRNSEIAPLTVVQASPAVVKPASTPAATTAPVPSQSNSVTENGGVGVREFQGDDVGQVLRLLARQAKVNMVVSEAVTGTVTMRLEDVTALQAIGIIVKSKGLFMDQIDNVYYIKTAAERTAEPTESDSYQFSYARAKEIAPLLASQLASKDVPQVDERTNTIFYRETRSNIDSIRKMLVQIDRPTKQVMIEARLVEVNANPKQSYGINWGGVVGGSSNPQTFRYGGSNPTVVKDDGTVTPPALVFDQDTGTLRPRDFFLNALPGGGLNALAGQFAILSVPQMSVTLRLLNEDSDAEFLANPRVVTADNQQAKIEIIRNQPVPQLNFNEQTATAVFGGFEDKKFGNTLVVRPSVNKDDFITLSVKPEISNKVADATFQFAGATVASPIIDTRTLDSNVLIKSGDTLAIGGLLQDEVTKGRTKVPIMGDIPILGYFFQEKLNARSKRNLLVFVTPTILEQRYGTGLEDQISGLHHSGEEFADPNGWRNNAKGAVRLVPTSNRQITADYPKPGVAPEPGKLRFISTAKERDF